MRLPEVTVTPRARRRIAARHPWIFIDDVVAASGLEPGAIVRVRDARGAPLGVAFWSGRSKIALRMIASEDLDPDPAFWSARVDAALARRGGRIAAWQARRLLFGESDGIPGLVADLYGRHLVMQMHTAGAVAIAETIAGLLRARLPIESVLHRNDASVRALEGLPREVVQATGTTPEQIVVEEEGVLYAADPWRGQKTGAFLDQRDNRTACRALGRGRVLDAFAYHASFALHAARGAAEVVVVDASREALERGRANARRNGLANLSFVEANAFDELREREKRGERFDLIVLDPPAFAKSRGEIASGRRGYKEINLRALRLLAPGGTLVTCSCSYNLDEATFEEILREAAADARRDATVVARRGQAEDHPVRLGFPESRYLKCFVLAADGAAP
ncbi:MAG TPA: class I SAM-dependent rRNA methyltransferase [Candidatus Polarisedimenticolaceae bacterium]|nr:class I SAM-dependent rRNA methyltransferase [Candidatus Polarisedimenticolaceae bacterium]